MVYNTLLTYLLTCLRRHHQGALFRGPLTGANILPSIAELLVLRIQWTRVLLEIFTIMVLTDFGPKAIILLIRPMKKSLIGVRRDVKKLYGLHFMIGYRPAIC